MRFVKYLPWIIIEKHSEIHIWAHLNVTESDDILKKQQQKKPNQQQ